MPSGSFDVLNLNSKHHVPQDLANTIMSSGSSLQDLGINMDTKRYTMRVSNEWQQQCENTDLYPALDAFVKEETNNFYDDVAEKAIEDVQTGVIDEESLIKSWEKAFREETLEYAEPEGTTDEELFSTVYHRLVHSPALETILQVEQAYALAVRELTTQRDEQLAELAASQTEEMSRAVEGVHVYSTEQEISALAARHFEDQNLLQGRWNSEVDTLRENQRREYRDWLVRMLEDHQVHVSRPTVSPPGLRPAQDFARTGSQDEPQSSPMLEESFTIHLGSQMKQMHNIRILRADALDFCRVSPRQSGALDPQPQRLQTALGLYSSDLCGLVLLTDSHMGTFSGLTKELSGVCQQSTEFHFSPVEDQLEGVRAEVKKAVAWRQAHWGREGGPDNLVGLTAAEQQVRRFGSSRTLQTGDVFITRHSNLAQVHVVFHMVVDDSLQSSKGPQRYGDINSRHSAILGLRNILKTACSNDITTLTVPVLLTHELTEDMTLGWCAKRAELVFKCMKGFMIEMASWGGSELKNLQFLVPKGISEDIFSTLATMLPSIFRVSNPLVFKVSSTPQTPKSG